MKIFDGIDSIVINHAILIAQCVFKNCSLFIVYLQFCKWVASFIYFITLLLPYFDDIEHFLTHFILYQLSVNVWVEFVSKRRISIDFLFLYFAVLFQVGGAGGRGGINCKQTSLRRKNKIKPKQNNQHVLLIVKYIVITTARVITVIYFALYD